MPRLLVPACVLAPLAAALLAAGCASGGGGGASAGGVPYSSASVDESAAARAEAAAGPRIRAGWMELRAVSKSRLQSLAFVNRSSPEGEVLLKGRTRITDAKVLEDEEARRLAAAFDATDFGRYAVEASPDAAPSSAMGVVWLDSGGKVRSLFLMPGAGSRADTRAAAGVYQDLKFLLLSLDQTTPGFRVVTGSGSSGEGFENPPPRVRR